MTLRIAFLAVAALLGACAGSPSVQSSLGPGIKCCDDALMAQLEDAHRRGVNWRGHDVGGAWHIDLGPGTQLTFARTGTAPQVFGRPARVINPHTGITQYTASQGARTISVMLATTPCRDMAGNTLPGSVVIGLDGVNYTGCGMPLGR